MFLKSKHTLHFISIHPKKKMEITSLQNSSTVSWTKKHAGWHGSRNLIHVKNYILKTSRTAALRCSELLYMDTEGHLWEGGVLRGLLRAPCTFLHKRHWIQVFTEQQLRHPKTQFKIPIKCTMWHLQYGWHVGSDKQHGSEMASSALGSGSVSPRSLFCVLPSANPSYLSEPQFPHL